jgi:tRNA modification GTPase
VRTILNALATGNTVEAGEQLAALTRFDRVGRHLVEPFRVVVAGAVNAGKSSLVNALAGYQRSVVTPLPGTTRDVVAVRVALDGWPVELADTAGLRSDAATLEEQGMHLARAAAASADLCLWVLDSSTEPLWPEAGAADVLLVVNKTDLPATWDLDRATGAVRVSALTGDGLAELCTAVSARLVPEAPAAGAAVPFTPELCDCIAEAHAHLTANRPGEAAALLETLSIAR